MLILRVTRDTSLLLEPELVLLLTTRPVSDPAAILVTYLEVSSVQVTNPMERALVWNSASWNALGGEECSKSSSD